MVQRTIWAKGKVWYFAFNPNTDATVYDPALDSPSGGAG